MNIFFPGEDEENDSSTFDSDDDSDDLMDDTDSDEEQLQTPVTNKPVGKREIFHFFFLFSFLLFFFLYDFDFSKKRKRAFSKEPILTNNDILIIIEIIYFPIIMV